MKKCVIWGMGEDYYKILNQLIFEEYKGNITVLGAVCKKEDRYCSYRDGYPVYIKEELFEIDYDYIIIASQKYFSEILTEISALGISRKKVINGQKFLIPLFDFQKYSNLIENPVTILSDDCWAGRIYNYLGLECTSPLKNIFWKTEEYFKFIKKPLFYLETDLEMEREGDLRNGVHPRGRLGKGNDWIYLELVHNATFSDAKVQWNKRKKLINRDNIFIKAGFEQNIDGVEKYIDQFKNIPYNKVLFYNRQNLEVEENVASERFQWEMKKRELVTTFDYNFYMQLSSWNIVDILSLLNGEKEFMREKI